MYHNFWREFPCHHMMSEMYKTVKGSEDSAFYKALITYLPKTCSYFQHMAYLRSYPYSILVCCLMSKMSNQYIVIITNTFSTSRKPCSDLYQATHDASLLFDPYIADLTLDTRVSSNSKWQNICCKVHWKRMQFCVGRTFVAKYDFQLLFWSPKL